MLKFVKGEQYMQHKGFIQHMCLLMLWCQHHFNL